MGDSCITIIRQAVSSESETNKEAFTAALDLLASHNDDSEHVRAAELVADSMPSGMSELQLIAACYLVRTDYHATLNWSLSDLAYTLLHKDGRHCGLLLKHQYQKHQLDDDTLMQYLAPAGDDKADVSSNEIEFTLAYLSSPAALDLLAARFAAGQTTDENIFSVFDQNALQSFIKYLRSYNDNKDIRRRLAYALRFNLSDTAEQCCHTLLDDEDSAVRLTAIRTLLYKQGRNDIRLSKHDLNTAVSKSLDRLELLVKARMPKPQQRVELFDLELEQVTNQALSELCSLLALFGDPASLLTAERGLKADDASLKRKSLDAMQEVLRTRHQKRILRVLDHYISPTSPSAEARDRVRIIPWLKRCSDGSLDNANSRLKALRHTALFHDIDGEKLSGLAHLAKLHSFEPGQVIVAKGDPGDSLFVILQGTALIDTGHHENRLVGYSQTFGELSVFDGYPRSATVIAAESCTLMEIHRDDFLHLMKLNPEVGLGVMKVMAAWLRTH